MAYQRWDIAKIRICLVPKISTGSKKLAPIYHHDMRVFACLLLHPCSHRECSLQAAEPIVPLELPHLCTSFRKLFVLLYFYISAFLHFCNCVLLYFYIGVFVHSVFLCFSPSPWTYCPSRASAPMFLLPEAPPVTPRGNQASKAPLKPCNGFLVTVLMIITCTLELKL